MASIAGVLRAGPAPSKRLTLIACILGSGIVFLDGTVVNVALPAIREGLHAGLAEQQWVVAAYLLTLSALILMGGSFGDLFGRRRVFAIGVAMFGAFSLLCAVAPSGTFLVVARALQGIAGAMLVPNTLALIMDTFEEDERGAAIGSWTAWTAIATVIGPLGGGILIGIASWRWVFAINVVPVLLTLWLLRYAPPGERVKDARVDGAGALLAALGLAGPVLALIEQPSRGWSSPVVFVPLVGGLALLGVFVWWEGHTRDPMLPLSLFRSRNFTVGNVTTFALYAGLGAATFLLALFLQEAAGYTALEAGLSLMPLTVITFFLSRRFGALADRIGPRPLMGFGPVIAGAGLLLMTRIDASGHYVSDVLPGVLVFGLGLAMTVAPLTAAVLAGAPPHHSGIASGVNNAVARVAGLLAVAVVGAVCAAQFASTLDARLPGQLHPQTRDAVALMKKRTLVTNASAAAPADRAQMHAALEDAAVKAFHVGIGIAGVLAIVGGLISLAGLESRKAETLNAEGCPGGAICGAGEEVRLEPPAPQLNPPPATARAG
ncbi:MAG TPA: MFS transporter [Thermoleophilaceae bacterium]|nr:MFS transporter [Thermoleophilaceae bacterium]